MAGTAIFDLDRTITRQPTWTRFCFYANRDRIGFWVRVPLWMALGLGLKLRLADRQAYKRYSLWLLSALERDVLEARARSFAARDIGRGLRPGSLAAIRQHQADGDRLILATACCSFLARHYQEQLGFDDLVATEVTWGDARTAPDLDGANCYGAEKLRRVRALEADRVFGRPVSAYSDHVSDLELLTQADYGFAVNPSRKLRDAARNGSVQVVDFDTA